ncbi:DUF7283 family protein [Halostagnicola bangensis]
MDLEAPADAWYVWFAVSIVSIAMVGIALGLPTGPPPDANEAANTIERTTGGAYETSSAYEHDANEMKIDGPTISLRNEHGTAHSSLSYGAVVPVTGNERLENITSGTSFETEYAEEISDPSIGATEAFFDDIENVRADNTGEWISAPGEMQVQAVSTVSPSVDVSVEPEEWGRGDTTRSLEFSYEANTKTQVQIETTGVFWAEDEPRTEMQLMEADESSSTSRYDIYEGDSAQNQLHYPFDIDVTVEGKHVCQETITEADHGEQVAVCGENEGDIDATEGIDWVQLDDETGKYRVTLVDS